MSSVGPSRRGTLARRQILLWMNLVLLLTFFGTSLVTLNIVRHPQNLQPFADAGETAGLETVSSLHPTPVLPGWK
ncbi:MAG: hypothetical protein AAF423_13635 [Pseudomonadota bacterium]